MSSNVAVQRGKSGHAKSGATEAKQQIFFDSGHAFPGMLPDLSSIAERALSSRRAEMLQYGERYGLPEMRNWVSEYLRKDNADVSPDEVLVVNGAKHGIDLICRLLLKPGDTIVVTAPTYYTGLAIFRSFDVEFIEVGQDTEGISTEEIASAVRWLRSNGRPPPKFIYNVPDFHNPTGVTMSPARRTALLELAVRHGIHVVEDSPYRHVRFEGEAGPSLKSLDPGGVVLNVGTFSKILAPGLRIGWVAGRRDLIARMGRLKSDGGSSPLVQRLILDFLADDRLARHMELARTTYRAHRNRMLKALRREIPAAASSMPNGGYYLWVTLPKEMSGDSLADRAREFGVSIHSGTEFFAAQAHGYPGNARATTINIRLAYSHADLAEIDEGIHRLAAAYSSLQG